MKVAKINLTQETTLVPDRDGRMAAVKFTTGVGMAAALAPRLAAVLLDLPPLPRPALEALRDPPT